MTKRGHVEKDAALARWCHTHGPAASFFNCTRLIPQCIKSHELTMNAHALSKHLQLHTFVVVALRENGYFTNNAAAAAVVVVRNWQLPIHNNGATTKRLSEN